MNVSALVLTVERTPAADGHRRDRTGPGPDGAQRRPRAHRAVRCPGRTGRAGGCSTWTVRFEAQGRGLGRALTDRALHGTREAGLPSLDLSVVDGGLPAGCTNAAGFRVLELQQPGPLARAATCSSRARRRSPRAQLATTVTATANAPNTTPSRPAPTRENRQGATSPASRPAARPARPAHRGPYAASA